MLWLRQHDEKVRYQVQAQERENQVKLMAASLDSAKVWLAERDSTIREKANQIRVQDSLAKLRVAQARQSTEKAVSDLRETLNDEQKEQLAKVVEGYERQVLGLQQQLENSSKLLVLEQQRVTGRDSVIAQMSEQLDSVTDLYFQAERQGKPTLAGKVAKWLPWAIAGAAILAR